MAEARAKISLEGREYYINDLEQEPNLNLAMFTFINLKMHELRNQMALLQRAKNSYGESVKQEIVAAKAGIVIEND